jgi:type I restriction enzyme M protein
MMHRKESYERALERRTDLARPTLNDDAKLFLAALRKQRKSVGNGFFRELLGWSEQRYTRVREFLIEQEKVVRGRGRGGSITAA